jgi:hypothetical protein
MAAQKKFGKNRHNVSRKVTSMRLKKGLSWAEIAKELEIAPRTARRIFQEKNGVGSHHGLLPGKGGRRPVEAEAAA